MSANHSSRRRRDAQLAPECLESRALLTGGAGSTFAIVKGEIAAAGKPTAVKVTLDPAHFKLPNGKITLGIDVVAGENSTVKPTVVSTSDATGHRGPAITRTMYDAHLRQMKMTDSPMTTAVLTTLKSNVGTPTAPVSYNVNVAGLAGTKGQFLLGFYLPGDADGDGKVTAADIATIKKDLGARANVDSRYGFEVDANRDGRIDSRDLRIAIKNLGASTDITPTVTANLDPAANTSPQDRVINANHVKVTGNLTPGGTVNFTEATNRVPAVSAKADAAGNYSVDLPLAPGQNTFKVATTDGFGQTITGTISPITYNSNPVTPASLATLTQQANVAKPQTS